MKKLLISLIFLTLIGCAGFRSNWRVVTSDTPPVDTWKTMPKNEFLLTEVNDWVNYHIGKKSGDCKINSEKKVALLKELGFDAEAIHCQARSKYEWSHSAVKVKLGDEYYLLDNGTIVDVPWKYDEVKRYCYQFILP